LVETGADDGRVELQHHLVRVGVGRRVLEGQPGDPLAVCVVHQRAGGGVGHPAPPVGYGVAGRMAGCSGVVRGDSFTPRGGRPTRLDPLRTTFLQWSSPRPPTAPPMLTGYNTDIRHGETVLHVQTEDKGRDNPAIE